MRIGVTVILIMEWSSRSAVPHVQPLACLRADERVVALRMPWQVGQQPTLRVTLPALTASPSPCGPGPSPPQGWRGATGSGAQRSGSTKGWKPGSTHLDRLGPVSVPRPAQQPRQRLSLPAAHLDEGPRERAVGRPSSGVQVARAAGTDEAVLRMVGVPEDVEGDVAPRCRRTSWIVGTRARR